jgi:hypothetical protein
MRSKPFRPLLVLCALLCVGLACCHKASPHSVTLRWEAPPAVPGVSVVGYNVYRSTTSGSQFVKIASRVPGPLSIPFLRATLHRYLRLEAESVYDANHRVHREWTRGVRNIDNGRLYQIPSRSDNSDPLAPVAAAAKPKQLRRRVTSQHRSSPFFSFERNAISRLADSSRQREVAPDRHRLEGRSEHSYCSQGRRSIRFAKEDRPEESLRLRKRLRPLADHSQLCGIPCR